MPPSMRIFANALTTADPSRRPSMRHAKLMFELLRHWLGSTRWVHWFLPIAQAYA